MARFWIGLLPLVLAAACSGTDKPVDAGWGLTCPGGRVTGVAVDSSGSGGESSPEAAVALFVSNPIGGRLPAEDWRRADFVPTSQGTAPATATTAAPGGGTQMAFVHRDGGRIDAVLLLRDEPGGWVVDGVRSCQT